MHELQVRLSAVDQLIPYQHNARTHSGKQIDQIAASIQEFGWTNPILVGPDRAVIAGHARLAAARKLSLTKVPVIELGHLSEAQRRALVVADNQLALNAGWDEELLRAELRALQDEDFDRRYPGHTRGRAQAPRQVVERPPGQHRPPHDGAFSNRSNASPVIPVS